MQRMSSFHGSFLLVGTLRFVWPLLFPKMRKRSLCSSWKQGKEERVNWLDTPEGVKLELQVL